ncbi:4Fe-4S binding protein [Aeromonas media]|uniref:4Fe-4S binding protein n=1 Tax=Aeromonas media TaxID=651 RepID=UPI001C0EB35B|nr:4Fe-4S binding protein [Aeromonas media]
MAIFTIRAHAAFDPGSPWSLELLVRRQTGPVKGVFSSFELAYQLPESTPPAECRGAGRGRRGRATAVGEDLVPEERADRHHRACAAAAHTILFFQDRLPHFLHTCWHRSTSLVCGHLVVCADLCHALFQIFAGSCSSPIPSSSSSGPSQPPPFCSGAVACLCWLCPFGALQELINEAARKLKVRQFELPFAVHERLWAIKYIILLVLFGISLESMQMAEQAAEVEPFKTAIILGFDRQWWFVLYAALLLVINLFTRKVYCRYICPLGLRWRSPPSCASSTGSSGARSAAAPASSVPRNARSRPSTRMGGSTPTNAIASIVR